MVQKNNSSIKQKTIGIVSNVLSTRSNKQQGSTSKDSALTFDQGISKPLFHSFKKESSNTETSQIELLSRNLSIKALAQNSTEIQTNNKKDFEV